MCSKNTEIHSKWDELPQKEPVAVPAVLVCVQSTAFIWWFQNQGCRQTDHTTWSRTIRNTSDSFLCLILNQVLVVVHSEVFLLLPKFSPLLHSVMCRHGVSPGVSPWKLWSRARTGAGEAIWGRLGDNLQGIKGNVRGMCPPMKCCCCGFQRRRKEGAGGRKQVPAGCTRCLPYSLVSSLVQAYVLYSYTYLALLSSPKSRWLFWMTYTQWTFCTNPTLEIHITDGGFGEVPLSDTHLYRSSLWLPEDHLRNQCRLIWASVRPHGTDLRYTLRASWWVWEIPWSHHTTAKAQT